jgi:hypothetical protein
LSTISFYSEQRTFLMLRLVLSAVVLAGVSETVRRVFADPLAATASDHAQAAATAIDHSPAPTWSWSSDAAAPAAASVRHDKNIAPAGWIWLGLGNAVPLGRVAMSFIVAGGVLLLALLVGIVVDGIDVRRRQKERRDIPPYDAW